MRSGDRREQLLAAATAVFGERGYVGATTDAIARAAGVSQPYVVRTFGTKEALFLAVLGRALDRMLVAFRTALAADDPATSATARISAAYVELLSDRGLLLSLMHAFVLGSDPVIGAAAREGFLCVARFLREEAGLDPEEARAFLAYGMLLNTLVGVRMADLYETDAAARELLDAAMPTKIDLLLRIRDAEKR